MIREDEPQAPSTRISKLGADGEEIAIHRGSDAGSLSRHFRGDLDWIVMKALEKDRTRRYDTAERFAADVERHLADEPVEAGKPGYLYRGKKYFRRNRAVVISAAAILVALLAGTGLALWGFVLASNERDDALIRPVRSASARARRKPAIVPARPRPTTARRTSAATTALRLR